MNRREMLKQSVAAMSAMGVACDLTVELLDPKPALIAIIIPRDCCNQYIKCIVAAFQEIDSPAILVTENDGIPIDCWAKIMFRNGEFVAVARTAGEADRANSLYRDAFSRAITKGLI